MTVPDGIMAAAKLIASDELIRVSQLAALSRSSKARGGAAAQSPPSSAGRFERLPPRS